MVGEPNQKPHALPQRIVVIEKEEMKTVVRKVPCDAEPFGTSCALIGPTATREAGEILASMASSLEGIEHGLTVPLK